MAAWGYACGDGAVQPPPTDPPRPTTLTVNPATARLVSLGATVQLSAEVRDQNGNAMTGTTVTWSSSSSSVAVDPSGLVTAFNNGSATVTGTAGSASGTATVTVAQEVGAVTVSSAVDTVFVPDTVRLSAVAADANGRPVVGAEFEWASSDTLVAVVDGEGLVTAVSAGEAEIAATSAGVTGRTQLTVVAPVPTVVAVRSDPHAPRVLRVRQTVQLSAMARDQAGRVMPDEPVSWSGGDTLVAKTDSTGLVTAVGDGETTVTATAEEASGSTVVRVGDREILELMYDATNGRDWTNNNGWLTEAPLAGWHGVTTDGNGRVVGVELRSNNLSGRIPPKLGNLANLELLDLWNNNLSGTIPAELGNLTGLLSWTSGGTPYQDQIPSELGGLASLEWLWLNRNDLSGTIPPELGELTNLQWLVLNDNSFSGPIPLELRGLANLRALHLNGNNLTGTVPPELGDLASVGWIYLDNNALSESLPADIGRLANLRELGLSNNAAMSDALLATLANLREIQALQAGDTDLCTPDDSAFAAWLEGVPRRRIASCAAAGASMAYLTQAVQSREFPVPLVAGEDALLRVFVTAERASDAGMPFVRASFHVNGAETHIAGIPETSAPIPTEIDEGNLSASANATIPRKFVRPGLEVVIEVDPDGTLDPTLGVARRIPETGRLAVDVRAMSLLDLTVIPFVWNIPNPDSTVIELAAGMARDPNDHELLAATRRLLPVADLAVKAHEPVWSSSNNTFDLIGETEAICVLEGGDGHWMGMMSGDVTGAGGVAQSPGRTNFSQPYSGVIAHELGHNMNLAHAPCGDATSPDPSFPYPDGSIGNWGYDFRDGGSLVSPQYDDLMGYCGPDWISDYHFTNALRYRLFDEGESAGASDTSPTQSLLLWGAPTPTGNSSSTPHSSWMPPARCPTWPATTRLSGAATASFSG